MIIIINRRDAGTTWIDVNQHSEEANLQGEIFPMSSVFIVPLGLTSFEKSVLYHPLGLINQYSNDQTQESTLF